MWYTVSDIKSSSSHARYTIPRVCDTQLNEVLSIAYSLYGMGFNDITQAMLHDGYAIPTNALAADRAISSLVFE